MSSLQAPTTACGVSAPSSTDRRISVKRDLTKRKSVDHTIRHGIASMIRSVARRDDFDLPDLESLAAIRQVLDAAIFDAAQNLREQEHSWAAIARELGVTRQEAHRRYRYKPTPNTERETTR